MKINYLDLSQSNGYKNPNYEHNATKTAFLPLGASTNREYAITSANPIRAIDNLSFTGDNIYDVVHFIPEGILNRAGGVGTVMEDVYSKLSEFVPEDKNGNPRNVRTRNFFFAPYYDGEQNEAGEGGKLNPKIKIIDGIPHYIVGRDKYPLKKILSGRLKEYDNNVLSCFKNASYIVYDASDSVPMGLKGKNPNDCSSKLYIVAVPKTLVMSKAYKTNDITGFAAYIGGGVFENCSQFAMATVDALPKMKALFDEDEQNARELEKLTGKRPESKFNMSNFDPRNFLVHDIHCAAAHFYISKYAQQGEEMYKNVNLAQYFHNVGTAYQCKNINANDLAKCMMSPEHYNKILNSKKFHKLAYNNETKTRPLSGPEIDDFFKKYIPGLIDAKGNLNPTMIPLTYAVQGNGYVRAAAVSGEYAKEIATIPEMTDGLQRLFYRAYENGSLIGIVNGSKLPTADGIINSPLHKELFTNEKNAIKKIITSEIEEGLKTLNKDEIKAILSNHVENIKVENLFLDEKDESFSNTQIKELIVKMLDVPHSGLDCEKKLYIKNLEKSNEDIADAIKNLRNNSSPEAQEEAKNLLVNKYGLSEAQIEKYINIPPNPNMDKLAQVLIREFEETQKFENSKKLLAQVISKNGVEGTFMPLLDDEGVQKIFIDKILQDAYNNLQKIASNIEDDELKSKLEGILASEKVQEAQKYLKDENYWLPRYKSKIVETIASEDEFKDKIDSLFAIVKDENTNRFSINIAKGDKIGKFSFDSEEIAKEFIKNIKAEDEMVVLEEGGRFFPAYNLGERFVPQTYETEEKAKEFLETIKKDLFVAKVKGDVFQILYKQRILPLKGFDANPFKMDEAQLQNIENIKKHNMQNLVERITRTSLDNSIFDIPQKIEVDASQKAITVKGAKAFPADSIISGVADRKTKVLTNFTENTIKWTKEHPERIRFLTSWGRPDVQKAYDVVLLSIKRFLDDELKMRNESWSELKTLFKNKPEFTSKMEEIDKKLNDSAIGADEKRNIMNNFLEKVNIYAQKNNLTNVSEIVDKMLVTPLFVICAGLEAGEAESQLVANLYNDILKIPELKGRFAFLDGWGPVGSLTTAADFTILPSNFAPCELTPLEGQVRGAITITANTGGLKQTTISEFEPLNEYQKNILQNIKHMTPKEIKQLDSAIAKHKEKNPFMSGFKTEHGYYTIKNDVYQLIDVAKDATELTVKNSFDNYDKKNAAKNLVEIYQALREGGANEESLTNDKKYSDAMRIYRTSVMADEVCEQLKNAIYADDEKIKQMRMNCLCKYSDWDSNTCVNNGKTAIQLIAKHFFQNFNPKQKTVQTPEDIEFADLDAIDRLEQETQPVLSFMGSVNVTTAVAAAAALAGATAILTTANHVNRREKEIELVKKQFAQNQYTEYKPATVIPKPEEAVAFNTNYCSIDEFKNTTNKI